MTIKIFILKGKYKGSLVEATKTSTGCKFWAINEMIIKNEDEYKILEEKK